jgi:hypothetical protein
MTTVRLSPAEYEKHALFGLDRALHAPVEVCGDLKISGLKGLRHLPKAWVTGSVTIEDCPDLVLCYLSAAGFLEVRSCPSLQKIAGSAGSAIIDGTAIQSIGADFECRTSCLIRNSPQLEKLNCIIGTLLEVNPVDPSRSILTGPAFKCPEFTQVPQYSTGKIPAHGNSHLPSKKSGHSPAIRPRKSPLPRKQSPLRTARTGL